MSKVRDNPEKYKKKIFDKKCGSGNIFVLSDGLLLSAFRVVF